MLKLRNVWCNTWIDWYWRDTRSVSPKEVLARFFSHKNHFITEPVLKAKHHAFTPRRRQCGNETVFETSMFLIGRLRDADVWRLGTCRLGRGQPPPPPYGRADLNAQDVTAAGLQLDADSRLHRHANIVGWTERKDEQKLTAQKLAKASHAYLVTRARRRVATRTKSTD